MAILKKHNVTSVYHYSPVHYLPFIARSKSLLSKPSIQKLGYPSRHLRSKSSSQDIARGFGSYVHLTLDSQPRILKAKLAAGFPHIQIKVPADAIDATEFSLCRYNVAMTRYLRRDGKPGFPESPTNGRYYGNHQIPIAKTDADKSAMLKKHLCANTMIEVLIHGDLILPDETTIVCFSKDDAEVAHKVCLKVDPPWNHEIAEPPGPYPRSAEYANAVAEFVEKALSDSTWKGNGLEFDRV